MHSNKRKLHPFAGASVAGLSLRLLAAALPIGLVAGGCGVTAKQDASADLEAIGAFFDQMPGERVRALAKAAPRVAEPIYGSAGNLRPDAEALESAAHMIMRTGGLLRANGDGTWRPIEEPSRRNNAQRLSGSKCNVIEWVAVDDTGERVAAGCPGDMTIWTGGKPRHVALPPGEVKAADFSSSGELRLILARGAENNSAFLVHTSDQRELRQLAQFDGVFAQYGCENTEVGAERLTVVGHDLKRPEVINILQVGVDGASSRLRPAPPGFSARGCIGLTNGEILRWAKGTNVETQVPAVLERIELDPVFEAHEVFARAPDGRSHSYTGTSADGAWAAFLEADAVGAPIGVLHIAATQKPGVEPDPWLAQLGATAGLRMCLRGVPCSSGLLIQNAVPLGGGAVVLLSTSRAAIVSRERWCDVALDQTSWAQGIRQSSVKFTRTGPRIAVPGRDGQVFLFTAEC